MPHTHASFDVHTLMLTFGQQLVTETLVMESTTPQGFSDAIAEGRRIYLGNLLYTAEAQDIEESLRASGFEDFEAVHVSLDAASGRNPGYCFVDFVSRESAERAIESLDATVGGRTLKVGPCKPKQSRSSTARWGSDNRSSNSTSTSYSNSTSQRWGSDQRVSSSSNFVDESVAEEFSKRVYVGGLSPSVDQALDTAEVSELFAGFNPVTISNRIKPHESTSSLPGNHHYCFVEFATKEEAQSAIDALNGKITESGPLKVSAAKPPPNKQRDQRSSSYNNTNNSRFGDRTRRAPRDQDSPQQSESSPAGSRSMASGNWRRKGD
ncbi:hypothetical protein E4U21_007274 [Claviceps maximensis]|nr:hypothetical protein E4U21_007274 [Claviceps maximensis]